MTEVVRGAIVGPHLLAWQLFYNGNYVMSNPRSAANQELAEVAAKAEQARLRREYGAEFNRLFPDSKLWELRVWN